MALPDEAPKSEPVPPNTVACPACGQSYKTTQGLAGHRRLAHSASSARQLDERTRELAEHKRAVESRAAEVARKEQAARRRESEAARRERAAREIEEVPESERVRRIVNREIASLPEVTTDTILRVNGRDYLIEDGRLQHLYFPEGEKTEFENGEWFQFEGRAQCITDGKFREVCSSTILAALLDEEEEA